MSGKNHDRAPTATSIFDTFKSKPITFQREGKNCMSSESEKRGISTKSRSAENWRNVIRCVETVTLSELGRACIDLDSVLLHHNHEDGISHLGRPLSLGRKLTWLVRRRGFKVIVLTSRPGRYNHGMIHQYLLGHGFAVDRVTNVKPAADFYADDKALRIPKNWK